MPNRSKVTDDLIISCTYEAVMDTAGVSSIDKSIRIDRDKRGPSVNVFVNVAYGSRITEVAWELQENIKHRVQDVAGIEVSKINVTVQGVE